ncbi:MAG: tyrosine-type recombinase/integrase [Nitrospirales bacterium]
MGLYKRHKVWWMSLTYQGRQLRRSTKTRDRKLAEAIEAKVRVRLIEGQYFDHEEGTCHTFAELWDRYEQEHITKKASQRALRGYGKHVRPFFGDRTLAEITPKVIVQYKAKRYRDGVKPATINRELAVMKHAFNLAIKEWEWATQNPVSRVSFEQENNQRDRWLSQEEERRVLAACTPWLKDMVIFALNTGMRMGEILALTWETVDLFRQTVTVLRSKNGDRRTIPLNGKVFGLLKERMKGDSSPTGLVFPSQAGTPRDGHDLRRGFRKALATAKIQDFHFHDLRHTFATRLVQAGVDLYKVQRLLGHRSPVMTQRYAHHSSESLRDGVNVLDRDGVITKISHPEQQPGVMHS